MTFYAMRANPGFTCRACGDSTRPGVLFYTERAEQDDANMCVYCMAQWIDSVTGWRLANQCLQALAVGSAGERFHHPERFVKPPRRENRQERLDKQK